MTALKEVKNKKQKGMNFALKKAVMVQLVKQNSFNLL